MLHLHFERNETTAKTLFNYSLQNEQASLPTNINATLIIAFTAN